MMRLLDRCFIFFSSEKKAIQKPKCGGSIPALLLAICAVLMPIDAAAAGKVYRTLLDANQQMFEVYDIATNSWTVLAGVTTGHQMATASSGKLYMHNALTNQIQLYDELTDSWSNVQAGPVGYLSGLGNLEVTKDGGFILSKSGSATVYYSGNGGWNMFTLPAAASALGDYDPITHTLVLAKLNSEIFWKIDMASLSVIEFNVGALNASETRRFGKIYNNRWYTQSVSGPVAHWGLLDPALAVVRGVSVAAGVFHLSASVDKTNGLFYVQPFGSTLFFSWNPVSDSYTPLLSSSAGSGHSSLVFSVPDLPPVGAIIIDAGAANTNTTAVTLDLACSDDVGCLQMQFSNDNTNWSAPEANAANKSWLLVTAVDGVRSVYVRFIDTAGNISNAIGDAIVVDTVAPAMPTITVPVNNTYSNSPMRPVISGTAEAGANVTLNDGGALLALLSAAGGNWSMSSGSALFSEGQHLLTITATDSAGNSGVANTLNYWVDLTAPVVSAPPALQSEATGPFTPLALGMATANDNIDGALIPVLNNSGPFAVGATAVTWSATDQAGNAGSAAQIVSVVDTTPPAITLPANLTLLGDVALGGLPVNDAVIAALIAGVTATDLVDGAITPTNNAPALFANGTASRITFTAIDASGNLATAASMVTVTVNNPAGTGNNAPAPSGTGLTIAQSLAVGLDPNALTTDTDGDGIQDITEVGDPANPYDSDADGVLDVFEAGVKAHDASLAAGLQLGNGSVDITSTGQAISNVSHLANAAGQPAGFAFPFGLLSYHSTVVVGASQTVSLAFSSPLPLNPVLYKVNSAGVYSLIPNGAGVDQWRQLNANSIAITLLDGGVFDLDGLPNGVIVDPVAVATSIPVVAPVQSYTSGGCVMASSSDGSLDPLLALLIVLSVASLMRRRQQSF